jgi:hypothetical protein
MTISKWKNADKNIKPVVTKANGSLNNTLDTVMTSPWELNDM